MDRFHVVINGQRSVRQHVLLLGIIGMLLSCGSSSVPHALENAFGQLPKQVDFNFHIRPLLSDRCYKCHGPDDIAREADLRLDQEESLFSRTSDGGPIVTPRKPEKSLLFRRIISEDSEFQMPPSKSHLKLSTHEKALIYKWIEDGAEWKDHWAFSPPTRPMVPSAKGPTQNPIDNFIRDRLKGQGLEPSPRANKERLARRLYFDLTGLPPDIEEVRAFVEDESPNAYSQLVSMLLQSEAYAERMAMEWLDVARFGDTQGMHVDPERFNWPWRDWVISAFRENMSYADFITWQIAGDLLPEATQEQRLATAFLRNHPSSSEGGVPDEEFRQQYVQERTNTTATAFLGLTLECATCRDHKFDPISQKEYFQMSAFFNNIKELGMVNELLESPGGGPVVASGPSMHITNDSIDQLLHFIEDELTDKRKARAALLNDVGHKAAVNIALLTPDGYYPFERLTPRAITDGVVHRIQGLEPVDLMVDDNTESLACGQPALVDGVMGKALYSATEMDMVFLKRIGKFEIYEPYTASAWIRIEKSGENQTIMGTGGAMGNAWRGWDFFLDTLNRPTVRLVSILPQNYVEVTASKVITVNEWTHVAFSYDGTADQAGFAMYINGERVQHASAYNRLTGTIVRRWRSNRPEWPDRPVMVFRSGRFHTGENGVFEGAIDEIRIFKKHLTPVEIHQIYRHVRPSSTAAASPGDLRLHAAVREDDGYQQLTKQLSDLVKRRLELLASVPQMMVMEEMPEPRPTFVLDRGRYDAPTQRVYPGTPNAVMPLADYLPNRLGLAQWMVDRANPLTARVAVNRYWQMIFGEGLVPTPEDFGIQGALPSHPELLDWLAVEFMESGWDLQHLLRLMVESETYRQSSVITDEHRSNDPSNRFLARAPSYRLPAEMIRDNALAASGLLNRKVGGPSVMPYQPEGIWGFGALKSGDYQASLGADLYRRSMYTYVRRTAPHPAMLAFDAPDRLVCTVKRETTNTPMQALVLLNDPQFVECTVALANRMDDLANSSISEKISYGFKLLCGRAPSVNESSALLDQFERSPERYMNDASAIAEILSVGEFRPAVTSPKVAALAVVASTMMNFDESYMRR